MNRTRFHDILHGNVDTPPMIRANKNLMVFHMKKIRKADTSLAKGTFGFAEGTEGTIGFAEGTIGFEEKDQVDILFDLSYNYFYLSDWKKKEEYEYESFEKENMDLSEIYVGDSQEKDMYFTNPLLEEK